MQVDVVLAEGDRRADLEVDVLADLGEQGVERLAQAVGEDERADDEGDADEDGDGDGDSRPKRARMLRRAMSAMLLASVAELLHPVEHPFGRRLGHLVDDRRR